MDLPFHWVGWPATAAELADAERRVGALPADHREFLLAYGGGGWEAGVFLRSEVESADRPRSSFALKDPAEVHRGAESVDELAEYVVDVPRSELERVPPAVDAGWLDDETLSLTVARTDGVVGGPAYRISLSDGGVCERLADSFADLMRCGFVKAPIPGTWRCGEEPWRAAEAGEAEPVFDAVAGGLNIDAVCDGPPVGPFPDGEFPANCWSAAFGRPTLLMAALGGRRVTLARLLLEHGADPNARNDRGLTPLMTLRDKHRPALWELLIDAGADPNAADADGATAFARAFGGTAGAPVADPVVRRLASLGVDVTTAAAASG